MLKINKHKVIGILTIILITILFIVKTYKPIKVSHLPTDDEVLFYSEISGKIKFDSFSFIIFLLKDENIIKQKIINLRSIQYFLLILTSMITSFILLKLKNGMIISLIFLAIVLINSRAYQFSTYFQIDIFSYLISSISIITLYIISRCKDNKKKKIIVISTLLFLSYMTIFYIAFVLIFISFAFTIILFYNDTDTKKWAIGIVLLFVSIVGLYKFNQLAVEIVERSKYMGMRNSFLPDLNEPSNILMFFRSVLFQELEPAPKNFNYISTYLLLIFSLAISLNNIIKNEKNIFELYVSGFFLLEFIFIIHSPLPVIQPQYGLQILYAIAIMYSIAITISSKPIQIVLLILLMIYLYSNGIVIKSSTEANSVKYVSDIIKQECKNVSLIDTYAFTKIWNSAIYIPFTTNTIICHYDYGIEGYTSPEIVSYYINQSIKYPLQIRYCKKELLSDLDEDPTSCIIINNIDDYSEFREYVKMKFEPILADEVIILKISEDTKYNQ